MGGRAWPEDGHRYDVRAAVAPEHALDGLLAAARPDAVIGASTWPSRWRPMVATARARDIPVALYLREESALAHLEVDVAAGGRHPAFDLLLANAEALAAGAAERGWPATFVPSVIDTSASAVTSARTHVLLVNPEELYGLSTAVALARRHPTQPFAFLESRPWSDDRFAELEALVRPLGNVELRRRVPAAEVFADAGVLLVPHRTVNRPRIVLEAQANGIPVVGSDVGGLPETIGAGGLIVSRDADVATWSAALTTALGPEGRALGEAGLASSRRGDVQPDAVASAFLAAIEPLVSRPGSGGAATG